MNDVERFWANVDKSGECWEWTGVLDKNKYGVFCGKKAHRLSYVIHHPLTIDLLEGHREICVCHRCDNPKCVNPAHLFLGSQGDNMRDRETKGRANRPKGEEQSQSKLTETQVREIRIKYANGGISYQQLALEYGVSFGGVGHIIQRRSWKHI